MTSHSLKSYSINIYLGLRGGYGDKEHDFSEVVNYLAERCKIVPFCYSVTPTFFVHTNGIENGAIIGIIQYPRFPKRVSTLRRIAIDIAEILRQEFKQQRVTIDFPNETMMLGSYE